MATYWGKQVNQPIFEYETNIFLSYCWWVSELSRFYAIYCKWASYQKLEVTMEYSSMHGWWYFINLSFINYHTAMEIIIFFQLLLHPILLIHDYPISSNTYFDCMNKRRKVKLHFSDYIIFFFWQFLTSHFFSFEFATNVNQ